MSPADAVLRAISDELIVVLEMGDVRLVRNRRHTVEIQMLSAQGRWLTKVPLSEIEAADLNNKLDELLRQ